jgi:hypothetical protein
VKGFEEAFIQLVSLETVTRFLQNWEYLFLTDPIE